MEILHQILVFVHLIGFAALFGGLFVQVRATPRVVNSAMLHGVLTQLVTGLLIVGLLEGMDEDVNHAKVGVKLVVALVIAVLAFANRKKPSIPSGLYLGLFALTVANVAVAVFWR